MASHGEWCEEKLSQLINEEQRLPVLQEMKDVLTSIPRNEASRTANSLRLPIIFDCLNDSNTEQVDLACDVLTLCMANLNLGESTNKYGVFLERALNHPFPAVKLMALTEIKRNIENDDILVDLCKRTSLITNVIKCIGDEDLGVAKKASDIVVKFGMSSAGIKQIIGTEALKEFHEIMGISEIVRLRLYEVLVKIGVQSEENLTTLVPTGLLNQILEELDSNDVLLKLNILEILTALGESKHGYNYLESNETLKRLSIMLDAEDPVDLQLCEPGILKFFGRMADWKPIELLSKYPIILKRLYNNLESGDFTLLGATLDTIGHIGSSNDGKVALDSSETEYCCENIIKAIAKTLPSLPTETKVRGLNCFENLLRVKEPNSQVTAITSKWFRFIDEDPIDFVWKYAKNPFAELRLAGFGIFNAIVSQIWGQEAVKNTAGLLEFLLDRNVETMKECKEAKYGIVEILAVSQIFDQSAAKKLQTFVRDGPFYVQTITEVATERNE